MRSDFVPLLCVFTILFCAQALAAGERVCLREACYFVDVADTPEAREQGLMARSSLEKEQGMFFIFDEEGIYPFWMKNMLFAIDIIWLDKSARVVHVASNVPPCTQQPCTVYTPAAKAMYVLEIPAGDTALHGIIIGDTLK
jgi:uncharacterized protein